MSPFCVKLETYLRMSKIEYKARSASFLKAPKGRIPYIEVDGQKMGDSSLIIAYLKKRFGDPLDGELSIAERAQALALQRLIEDHLYFVGAWLRWSEEESWHHVRELLQRGMPPVFGGLILNRIRKGFLDDLRTQGMGRHTREEVVAFGREDLAALAEWLGKKPFFLGERPTSIDATAYGFLVQQLWVPWRGPLREFVEEQENLVAFCDRMKQRFWS